MTLIEIVDEMKKLDAKKNDLQTALRAMQTGTYERTIIEINHKQYRGFHEEMRNQKFEVNTPIFKDYIQHEIDIVDKKLDSLTDKLIEMRSK